jgi:hypothetical protein
MESLRPSPWQSSSSWSEMAASADRSVEPSPIRESEGRDKQRNGGGTPLVFGHFAMPEDTCWARAGADTGRLAAPWEAEAARSWPYGGADSPRQHIHGPGAEWTQGAAMESPAWVAAAESRSLADVSPPRSLASRGPVGGAWLVGWRTAAHAE